MADKMTASCRMLFKSGEGPKVLGHILRNACRFFGRINEKDDISDEEIYIRQQVGREIIWSMGAMPGPFIDMEPDKFVRTLLNVKENNNGRRSIFRRNKLA